MPNEKKLTEIQHETRARLMEYAERLGLSYGEITLIFGTKITKARVYQIINNYRSKQLKS